ncbi:MAG: hypothetical protein E6Q97_13320 [Desulfurellales bacterium]|nr:MAG: hypothetical protein E6Q97_13320 [Desulfurellales bacterium]
MTAASVRQSNLPTLWSNLPSYESNPNFLPYAVQGQGLPGIYDQIRTQVPTIANILDQAEIGFSNLGVEWAPPIDATTEELRFNSALIALVRDRLIIHRPDFNRHGFREFLAFMPCVEFYGFGLFDTEFTGEDVNDPTATLGVKEILRSSVYRWEFANQSDQFPASVWVRNSTGFSTPAYSDLIHIARGGVVGLVMGEARARPIIAPALNWRGLQIASAAYAEKATGIVVVTTGDPEKYKENAEDYARYEASIVAAEAISQGRALFYAMVDGQKFEILYPSGQIPDFSGMMENCERIIKEGLGDLLTTMTTSGNTGNGVAGEFAEQDMRARRDRLTSMINRAWQAIGLFVARRSDYTGRIFNAQIASDEQESTARWLQVITDAKREDVLGALTPEDDAEIRNRLKLPLAEAEEKAAPPIPPALAETVAGILRSITTTDPTQRLSATAALEIIIAAGVPRETAQSMVDAQTTTQVPLPEIPATPEALNA